MKSLLISIPIALLLAATPTFAQDDWTSFLKSINVQAGADLPGFKAQLSAQFKVSPGDVEVILSKVEKPADAYMCLKIGEITKKPPEVVIKEYQRDRDKGWGVMAKNMGIKPGSKEFHELKRGAPTGEKAKGDGGKGRGKKDK